MGKSLELLGLAAFNVFVALILSATFISHGSARLVSLSEDSIKAFLQESSEIAGGLRKDMDSYSITQYFMDHIAPDGQFRTTMRYNIPDMPEEERVMEMDKMNFIAQTLQGMHAMADRETLVKVEYVKIDATGRNAEVVTTNYERGLMPVADVSGEANMMPVQGVSYCEQTLVLSDQRKIQMANAKCTTDLSFSEGL
jgi:hypothetical protein